MMMSRNTKLIAVFIAMLIVGVLIWQTKNNAKIIHSINSFEECVAAGYPIRESYPERCSTSDGKTFTRQISQTEGWQEQTFNEVGLAVSFKMPPDTTFRKEMADDGTRVRVASFYVEKGQTDNPTYQLYAVYQPLEDATEKDLDRIKTGMNPDTVKAASIDGYDGVEGLIEISGPKNHYSMAIIKDGKLFTVSTWPPTQESKELTDKIVATFDFK